MKNFKRFSVVVLLTGAILISCGVNRTDKEPDDSLKQPDEATESADPRFTPNLPDMDFDGYEFRSLTGHWYQTTTTFNAEEETGDTINDAIYSRNRCIEEKFNVVFVQIDVADHNVARANFTKSVLAASDDFDLCATVDFYCAALAAEGYVLSADNLPYVDLTQPWYMRDVNDAMSLGNKCYIVYGDECINAYESALAVCFNKKLIADYTLENPYEIVNGGKWTFDKFFEMSRSAATDLNGDGVMDDADRYGIVTYTDLFGDMIWGSCGIRTVTKDPDGMLILNVDGNEKFFSILDKCYLAVNGGEKIYFNSSKDKTTVYKASGESGGSRDISRQQFENDLGLFHPLILGWLPPLRGMETDFGVIPTPKYDESQTRYYALLGNVWPKVVPVTASDRERTSILVEALAAESRNTTTPAFKETCLKTKFTRDNESEGTVEIIFNSMFIDPGVNIYLEVGSLFFLEFAGSGNFTSVWEKNAAKLQKGLDTMNENLLNLK